MTAWGPFVDGLAADERKARLRALRMAVKLLCGERGAECRYRLLRAEIEGDDAVADAHAALRSLTPLDQRRVLASYAAEVA